MRSHPPSLVKTTLRTLSEECRLERGERLLIAVSGGGDSTALMHVLSVVAPKLGVLLEAHGVDHGLRTEAAAELDLARDTATRLGIEFRRTTVEVRPGGNLQARARDARRAALSAAARCAGATRIATAHHALDRAETVLIRLLHGGSAASLGVLAPVDGSFVRPFIRAPKDAIAKHLARHALRFASDPSNDDRRFLRVRVRAEVMPLLEALSPGVVDHLNGLADELTGTPISPVIDDTGRPIALRRAHLRELRRALELGRSARIRLSGDREIVLESGGRDGPRLQAAPTLRRFGGNGQNGDAKSEKRG